MTRTFLVALCGCSGALAPDAAPDLGDRDGDGWTVVAGDCADADPAVNPLAVDVPGDDLDQDCDGSDDAALDLRSVAPGDLRITEILPAPLGVSSSLGEWFEVSNTSALPIDLQGLLVHDALTDDFVVAGVVIVAPGAAAVLGGWIDPELNGGTPVDYAWTPGFGLTNAGDTITLEVAGLVLESVTWDPTWTVEDGYSLSRDPTDPAWWCLAAASDVYGVGGRGTPGAVNPPCPGSFDGIGLDAVSEGELVVTEIMKDPAAVDGDFGEWFEIFNASGREVELQGLRVSDDSGDAFEVVGSVRVDPDGYVVFAASDDRSINGDLAVDVAWGTAFGLSNSEDTVRISYGTQDFDVVTYDNGDTFPDAEGESLSLDPGSQDAVANDAGSAWCSGSTPYGDGDLGTPGAPNPGC